MKKFTSVFMFLLVLVLLFSPYSWGGTCKQEALGSDTPSMTYKSCLEKEKKRRAVLLKAMKKYKEVVGYCGTKEDRLALGLKKGIFSDRYITFEAGSWKFNRIVNGWVVYTLRDPYGNPLVKPFVVAVRKNTMRGKPARYISLSSNAECLGKLRETKNTDWFGFPVSVRYYEAIYGSWNRGRTYHGE